MSKKEMILPLEKQVCAFEYSEKLEELGVKQESLWWWNPKYPLNTKYAKDKELQEWYLSIHKHKDAISAFTCAELGEKLPNYVSTSNCGGGRYSERAGYLVCENQNTREAWIRSQWRGIKREQNWEDTYDKTLANAMAKMLIYLIENKLMEA